MAKNVDGTLDYYQVAETAAGADTFAREVGGVKNTGDKYNKVLLTMDMLESNDAGIARRNVVNWLTEGQKG